MAGEGEAGEIHTLAEVWKTDPDIALGLPLAAPSGIVIVTIMVILMAAPPACWGALAVACVPLASQALASAAPEPTSAALQPNLKWSCTHTKAMVKVQAEPGVGCLCTVAT